jgi:hypothetical protein
MAIPAIKSRRGPRRRKPGKLHGDKAYNQVELREWVRKQGIAVRIARKGIESSTKLGRHRWVIERSMFCLAVRLPPAQHPLRALRQPLLRLLTLAATLTCYKKLRKAAT